jgi:hypothetical protein
MLRTAETIKYSGCLETYLEYGGIYIYPRIDSLGTLENLEFRKNYVFVNGRKIGMDQYSKIINEENYLKLIKSDGFGGITRKLSRDSVEKCLAMQILPRHNYVHVDRLSWVSDMEFPYHIWKLYTKVEKSLLSARGNYSGERWSYCLYHYKHFLFMYEYLKIE